jgi:hypothetical protein
LVSIDDQQLIRGVLVVQAGFATPAQVMAAASVRLLARDGRSLLDHLVEAGALSSERRELVEGLAREALAAREGDAHEVLHVLGGERQSSARSGPRPANRGPGERLGHRTQRSVERPGQYTRMVEIGRGGQSVVWRATDSSSGARWP